MKQIVTLRVNGEIHELAIDPAQTLLEVLRNDLGLTGTKEGCSTGECGCCTVIMGGKPAVSCLVLAEEAQESEILTIEGLAKNGKLHPLQEAFIEYGAIQCGFCTPGMILSAKAMLDVNPDPSEDEVKEGIAGNLCRCTGYVKIIESILAASQRLRETE